MVEISQMNLRAPTLFEDSEGDGVQLYKVCGDNSEGKEIFLETRPVIKFHIENLDSQ